MNNKKLFKGALVLFASILMAVSCSSGDKTGSTGNYNTNKDDTTTPTEVAVSLDSSDTTTEALKTANSTKTVLQYVDSTTSFKQENKTITLKLSGDDAESLEKANIVVSSIVGLDASWNNTTIGATAKKDLSTSEITKELAALKDTFTVEYTKNTKTATLTADNKILTSEIKKALAADNDVGALKLTLTISKTDKKSKNIEIFVGIKRVNA